MLRPIGGTYESQKAIPDAAGEWLLQIDAAGQLGEEALLEDVQLLHVAKDRPHLLSGEHRRAATTSQQIALQQRMSH